MQIFSCRAIASGRSRNLFCFLDVSNHLFIWVLLWPWLMFYSIQMAFHNIFCVAQHSKNCNKFSLYQQRRNEQHVQSCYYSCLKSDFWVNHQMLIRMQCSIGSFCMQPFVDNSWNLQGDDRCYKSGGLIFPKYYFEIWIKISANHRSKGYRFA